MRHQSTYETIHAASCGEWKSKKCARDSMEGLPPLKPSLQESTVAQWSAQGLVRPCGTFWFSSVYVSVSGRDFAP